MPQAPVTDPARTPLTHLVAGARLGATAGAGLATAYTTVVIPLGAVALMASNVGSGRFVDSVLGAAAGAVCGWPFAVVLGILPGAALGAIGGAVTGLLAGLLGVRARPPNGALLGLLVALAIVGAGHAFVAPGLLEARRTPGASRLIPYLFWIGGPSLLVLLGIGWTGWRLGTTPPRE